MELYVPLFPWIPRRVLILILTAYCASLFPCSVCLDAQYELCQSNITCDDISLKYPFGVEKSGCGLPGFQIDCAETLNPVIRIDGLNYAIPRIDYENKCFFILREDNCQFSDEKINADWESRGTGFTFAGVYNGTLNVYTCNTQFSDAMKYTGAGGPLRRCNASVYYSFYDFGVSSIPGCSMKVMTVPVTMMQWISKPSKRDEMCQSSEGICGYDLLDPTAPFRCYCKDGPRHDKCLGYGTKGTSGAAIGAYLGTAVVIAAGLLVGITFYRRRKSFYFHESPLVTGDRDNEYNAMEAATLGKIGTLPLFSYEVLKQATNDFDEKNQLGDGAFASVYLGTLPDGRAVAVKRLYQDNHKRFNQFINEVHILSTYYHPNLVRLYGCNSPQSQDLLLVYEYVQNGTLADHLHGELKKDKGLNWDTRLKICIEIAQALAFLHSLEPPIYHRDVKSTNILLDKHFDVKVGDFGISRFVPLDATHVSTAPQGTPGYVDPEYHQHFQLTDKSDVYSFGVVLMEIISAKVAVDISRGRGEILLAKMAIAKIQAEALHEMIDPNLEIDSNPDIKAAVNAVAKLAFKCLAEEKERRPYMKEVVAELEQIKQTGAPCRL